MRTLTLALAAIATFGCDNDDELRRQNAELQAEIARLRQEQQSSGLTRLESFRVPQPTRQCTLERAKELHPDKVAKIEAEQSKARQEFEAAKQARAKLIAEAKRLPAAPAALGPSPTIEMYDYTHIPGMTVANSFNEDDCNLAELYGENISHTERAADWRVLVANAMKEWNEFSARHEQMPDRNEDFEDFDSGIIVTSYDGVIPGDNLDARKAFADRMVRLLSKGGAPLQWLVGTALRFQPHLDYTATRMRRLYAVTSVNFADLDREVRAAEATASTNELGQKDMPPEYRFDPYGDNHGGYYKGLLLRRWREQELNGRGNGDAYIRNVRKVLKGLAKGMGITLD